MRPCQKLGANRKAVAQVDSQSRSGEAAARRSGARAPGSGCCRGGGSICSIPPPLDIEIEDIAHGLARVARWNGQTNGAHIFSVAQHCLLVEALARARVPRLDRSRRLAVLLHDAPEYVIGDMISPFKAVIGDAYKAVERRLLTAIHLRFGLPAQSAPELETLIKTADRAGGLSRSDPARRLRGRRSAAVLRPAAGILRRDGARLPQTLAGRDGAGALSRAVQETCSANDEPTCAAPQFAMMSHLCRLRPYHMTAMAT